jgi:diketogulonate reductase-like aldo/keto reductase
METIALNSGVEMPVLGLGVFQTPPDETRDAVRAALGVGYRHIDTAAVRGPTDEMVCVYGLTLHRGMVQVAWPGDCF